MRMNKKVIIAGIAIILADSAFVVYIWTKNKKNEKSMVFIVAISDLFKFYFM